MVNALGIDVAKAKLDVVLFNAAQQSHSGVFANNAQGFEQLQRWLSKWLEGDLHACLEATGHYGEALAEFLHQASHTVSVVNPAWIVFVAGRVSSSSAAAADAGSWWFRPQRRVRTWKSD